MIKKQNPEQEDPTQVDNKKPRTELLISLRRHNAAPTESGDTVVKEVYQSFRSSGEYDPPLQHIELPRTPTPRPMSNG